MNKRYLVVDAMNSYFRALHVSSRGSDIEERVSYALHVTLQIINSAWSEQNADHIVLCLEGRSWRKDFYKPYKANRDVKRQAATVREQEEMSAFLEGYSHLVEFLTEHTNITILQHKQLEADDLIAGWIQGHPDDHHTIISSDSDYHQLLAENVNQYNGVAQELHTLSGILDKKGKRIIDKKTKLPKTVPDPKFILFEKITRGDPTDNIFSAYPGVRTKGTKNKVGLVEAFEDRDAKGYNYNNFMLQRWTDHDGKEHRVLDDFERNRILVDLTAQPADIREAIETTVKEQAITKNKKMVGVQFLKFCGRHELTKISEGATKFAMMFNAAY